MSYIRTAAHRKRMSENNPMKNPVIAKKSADAQRGKKLSLETREKISKSQKGKHHSPNTEFKLGCKHKKMTDETKNKIRNTLMGHVGANKGKKLGPKSEATKEKIRIARSKQIITPEHRKSISVGHIRNPNRKFKDTIIEKMIEEELKLRNINFLKQVSLCDVAIVDFYIPASKIVIECDGCYYHCCPEHGHKTQHRNIIERDANKDIVLRRNGFSVYRFWEHDIKINPGACIDQIKLI